MTCDPNLSSTCTQNESVGQHEVENSPNQSSGPKTKKRKNVSDCWNHFKKFEKKLADNQIEIKATCNYCNKEFSAASNGGTSHLTRHSEKCLKRSNHDIRQSRLTRSDNGEVVAFVFYQGIARYETARYFVQEEIPFHKVEKPTFHRYVLRSYGPQFDPPCRNTLRSDIEKIFVDEKSMLKDLLSKLPGKICLTSDLWTSNQKIGYSCITAHFIDRDWKLHKRIINFSMIPSPHTGSMICDSIYENLLNWNISNKILSLTLDNASSNDCAVGLLKHRIFTNDLNKKLFHIRCSAHVLNLLVQEGLRTVRTSLENIRESVRYVTTSVSRQQKFNEICKSFGLKTKIVPIDVQHRRNSTYLMLKAAIPYENVFASFFCGVEFNYKPSVMDWKNALMMRDFLKKFYESTKLFSGTKYVTSSEFYFQVSNISHTISDYSKDSDHKMICDAIRFKFDKYWDDIPLALGLASIMDPRYKLSIIELCLELHESNATSEDDLKQIREKNQKNLDSFKNNLKELFEQYKTSVIDVQTGDVAMSTASSNPVLAMLAKKRQASGQRSSTELGRYLEEPTLNIDPDKPFSVLSWWKSQEGNYQVLSRMARDLLTIPVSTVASESTFSAGDRVLDKHRSSLTPEIVEALICLKDWFDAEDGIQNEEYDETEEQLNKSD